MGHDIRQVLGDYRIIEEIGAGGMGRVFLAENIHHRKRYAVKVLPEELGRDQNFRARFSDEARVMSDLNHPNIVRVHHMGEDDGVYYLVMDYVCSPNGRSRSIHDELSESPTGRIAPAKAHKWITQVAEGLAYAHDRGVIHRDIKPANVLIDLEGNARITDFGLVKAVGKEFLLSQVHKTIQQTSASQAWKSRAGMTQKSALHLPGVLHTYELAQTTREDLSGGGGSERSPSGGSGSHGLFGTYDYMSPELLEGKDATTQSDIYSLGVMTYRMLTGRRPVGLAKSPSTVVRGLSKKWNIITARCLADTTADRYSSVETMLDDLGRIDRRSRRRFAAILGLVFLVGVLSLGTWAYRLSPGPNRGESKPVPSSPPTEWEVSKGGQGPLLSQRPEPNVGRAEPGQEGASNVQPRAEDPGMPYVKRLQQAFDDCYLLDEPIPDSNGDGAGATSLRVLRSRWEAVHLSDPEGEGVAFVDRVVKLEDIEGISDAVTLITHVNSEDIRSEAVTAWRRLGVLRDSWPVNQDEWRQCGEIQSELLEKLRLAIVSTQDRRSGIEKQIVSAGQDCEKTFRCAMIKSHLQTIREKSGKDNFLLRVVDVNVTDINDLTVLQAWEKETEALANSVSADNWRDAFDLTKFYQPGEKGYLLLNRTPLGPSDPNEWLRALKEYTRCTIVSPPGELIVEIPGATDGEERIKLELILIKAKGLWFWMGISRNPNRTKSELDPLPNPAQLWCDFYIGKYEITQQQYEAVTQVNPGGFTRNSDKRRPVRNISWGEADGFCKKLRDKANLRFLQTDGVEYRQATASVFRLPSEKEWEYACRARTGTEYEPAGDWLGYEHFHGYGDDDKQKLSDAVCWYGEWETDVVGGGRTPNGFGLYDMHGNVWEWCSDEHKGTGGGEPVRTGHVIRGGAYNSTQWECRSGWRSGWDGQRENIGFRVILEVK